MRAAAVVGDFLSSTRPVSADVIRTNGFRESTTLDVAGEGWAEVQIDEQTEPPSPAASSARMVR
jgi:hypothetical protein